MKHIILKTLIAMLVLSSAGFAYAETDTDTNVTVETKQKLLPRLKALIEGKKEIRTETRADVKAIRIEAKGEIKDRREEAKSDIKERKEEVKGKIEEKRIEKLRERVENRFEKMNARFQATIERLEGLVVRVQSRIEKIKNAGGDILVAERYVNDAKVSLEAAKVLLISLKTTAEATVASAVVLRLISKTFAASSDTFASLTYLSATRISPPAFFIFSILL